MKLYEYLKIKNIKQEDFAKAVGIKQNTISNYIAGRRTPKPDIIKKINEVTNGSVTYGDWYKEKEETDLKGLTLSQDNFNLREAIMQHFSVSEDYKLIKITNTANQPTLNINNRVVVDVDVKVIETGYFLIQINEVQEIFKVVRNENKIILSNNFNTLEYKKEYLILGKIVGKVVFEAI